MYPLGGYWIHWQLLLMRLPTYLNRSWERAQYGILYTLKSAPMCSGSFLNVCNWTEVGWNAPADSRKLTIPALQQIERFPRCLALVLYLQGKRGQQHRSHLAISSCTSPADNHPHSLLVKIKPRDREVSVEEMQPKWQGAKHSERMLLVAFKCDFNRYKIFKALHSQAQQGLSVSACVAGSVWRCGWKLAANNAAKHR